MAKARSHYLCRSCGGVQTQWMGKCPDCGVWDGLERFVEPKPISAAAPGGLVESWRGEESSPATLTMAAPKAVPLPEIEPASTPRLRTAVEELDRVLGGGFVPGSVVLLGGDPGIGKSTLMLQAAARLARSSAEATVLYVSSEESAYQTRLRAERLFAAEAPGLGELDHLYILADTNLQRIVEQARRIRPALLILDSVQMVYAPDQDAAPGSASQLRRCCTELVYLAKTTGTATVLVGHVTKDGQLAGPKLLEHLVDAVLSFEGDRHHAHRVVRAVKNRFGTTAEVGLFAMTDRGLEQVRDPGAEFDPSTPPPPGSVLCPVMQGTRSLLVEVQALTAAGFLGSAKRKTSGLDGSRLAMLIAVLEQHGGLRLADQDVFVSTVGGMRIVEPAADLALCLAIAGAHYRKRLPAAVAVIGEVGLDGELRQVHQIEKRLAEARRLGCRRILMRPDQTTGKVPANAVIPVTRIADALGTLEAGEPTGARSNAGTARRAT